MKINIIEYFESTVQRFPSKTAIIDGDREISFDELERRAKALAIEICKFNCLNKPIAVFLPKSLECIISDISITYSGNAYMNLDVNSPAARIGNILKQIQPVAVITHQTLSKVLRSVDPDLSILIYEDVKSGNHNESEILNHIRDEIIDSDPLCIINTSGSTGTPKGAVLSHRSYIDYLEWALDTFNFDSSEILGVLSPVVFDHYNYEICLMMARGCTLVLLNNQHAPFPVILLETLQKHNVTYIFWVPSIMVNIANMDLLRKVPLPSIKFVWFAGEVFPTKQFNYWQKHLHSATFVNLYGPVETTVDCTYFIVNRTLKDEEPIPIGFPCRNTDILILTDKDEAARINEIGELCVRGTSLAMGYYNDPQKTASVFVQNPLNTAYPELIYRTGDLVLKNNNGELIFKGRKDTLIKHMGYRIELVEIEHIIINTLKLADTGCVVYDFDKKEVVLFYEAENIVSVSEMRKAIAMLLPKYMIPSRFIKLDLLPRNTNGKIDRFLLSSELTKIS